MPINQEKLNKLKQQKEKAQIGGKVGWWPVCTCLYVASSAEESRSDVCLFITVIQGTARRKRKVVHKTATDDKKLQVRACNHRAEYDSSLKPAVFV